MTEIRFIRVKVADAKPGMVTALPVRLNKRVILNAGAVLDEVVIQNLIEQKEIGELAIESEFGEEIVVSEIKREMDVIRSVSVMKELFGEEGKLSEITKETARAVENLTGDIMESLSSDDNILLKLEELRSHDDYTYKHCLRVAVISAVIGKSLGLEEKVMKELCASALLHDIGMMKIDPKIIKKEGKLDETDFEEVKKHPQYGFFLLRRSGIYSADVMNGVMQHQERMNGSGHPRGLSGDRICFFARIIMIADVYDALTSNRSYRASYSSLEAEEYIMGAAGTLFDYDVVKAFLKVFFPFPVGIKVVLSDGRHATVTGNSGNALRPIIEVDGKTIDLYNNYDYLTLSIARTLHEELENELAGKSKDKK